MATLDDAIGSALSSEKRREPDALDAAISAVLDPSTDEAAVRSAVRVAPDAATQQWRLSQDTGVPVGMVRGNESRARELALSRAIDVVALERDAPRTAARLRDPDVASAVVDDVSSLGALEQWSAVERGREQPRGPLSGLTPSMLQGTASFPLVGAPVSFAAVMLGENTFSELVDTIVYRPGKRAGFRGIEAFGGIEQSLGEANIALGAALRARAADVPRETASLSRLVAMSGGRPDPAAGRVLDPEDLEAALPAQTREEYAQALEALGHKLEAAGVRQASAGELRARLAHELSQAFAPQAFAGEASKFLGEAVEATLTSIVPLMGLSIAGGPVGPALGLGFMGTQVYGSKYAEARRSGRLPNEAAMDGMFYALAETVPEVVPLGIALRAGKGGVEAIVRKTLGTALAEAGQESVTEALQMAYDIGVVGDRVTLKDALLRIAKAGALGFVIGAPMGAVGGLARDTAQRNERYRQEQERIADLLGRVRENRTLPRDAGLFEAVTANTLGEVTVYADAGRMMQLFQEHEGLFDTLADAVPEVREQIEEAVERGGDLVLPANKVLAALTTNEALLAPVQGELRLTSESMTDEQATDANLEAAAREVLPSRDIEKLVQDPRIQEVQVKRAAIVDDTGGLAEYEQPAPQALQEAQQRVTFAERLVECLGA